MHVGSKPAAAVSQDTVSSAAWHLQLLPQVAPAVLLTAIAAHAVILPKVTHAAAEDAPSKPFSWW